MCEPSKYKLRFNVTFKGDPTRTLTLRNRFVVEMKRRFGRLKRNINEAIIKNDVFGLKRENFQTLQTIPKQFDFPEVSDQVLAFTAWLQKEIDDGILEETAILAGLLSLRSHWTDGFIQSGYHKGIIRGRQELIKAGVNVVSIKGVEGVAATSSQPFHSERLKLLSVRAFEELKNITQVLKNQITRILAEDLLDGSSPERIVEKINGRVDKVGISRAAILAITEIIRAHHAALIEEYIAAGIIEAEIIAEWATARDSRVCPLCAPLEGRRFKLILMRNMIPRHPRCRCMAIPVVGEEARRSRN